MTAIQSSALLKIILSHQRANSQEFSHQLLAAVDIPIRLGQRFGWGLQIYRIVADCPLNLSVIAVKDVEIE